MEIECDPDKSNKNVAERGFPFALAEQVDWETALVWEDDREDYGEARYRCLGLVGRRVYAVVFVMRGEVMRIISMRKANNREVEQYEQQA
jgi:uncharacterized protein